MDVPGKTVIVTGAASGLGRATCAALARAGAAVFGFDLGEAWTACGDVEGAVAAVGVDVRREHDVRDAVRDVVAQRGALHVVVNCAGIIRAAKTVSNGQVFPLAMWEEVLAVNLTGTFNMCRFAAQAMSVNALDERVAERGVIVNVASGAASQGQVGQIAYSASKAGVVGMTLPMARDLAEHAIRVVAIAPGLFDTAMAAGMPRPVSDAIVDRMVLFPKRQGRPEEFAQLVRHVVENEYLNAVTLDLDAGTRTTPR